MNVVLLPLDTIGYQSDRTTGGMGDLKTLAESIKKLGLLSPLVVAKQATGSYQLIAGRRRFEAVKLLGWSQVPARIHDSTDEEDLAEISLTENVNRLDMHPLDEAVAFDHLVRKGIPLKDIALRYDRSVSAIYQRLCLMKLLPELKQMFYRGGISLTVAAMLSGLPLEQQEIFYRKHQKYGNIPGYFVHDFIHQVQHCRLGLVLDHKCHACTSRTRHSDRELFPEYEHLEDVCFKESCYRKKLLTQIARKIKEAEQEAEREHDAVEPILIIHDSVPLLAAEAGTELSLNRVSYELKKPDGLRKCAEEDGFSAWELRVKEDQQILVRRASFTAAERSPSVPDTADPFDISGVVVAEEKPEIEAALKEQYESPYYFNSAVRERVFKEIIRRSTKMEPEPDIVGYIARQIVKEQHKTIYQLYTGRDFTGGSEDAAAINALSYPRLFQMLTAFDLEPWDMQPEAPVRVCTFAGLSKKEYTALYDAMVAEVIADSLASKEQE